MKGFTYFPVSAKYLCGCLWDRTMHEFFKLAVNRLSYDPISGIFVWKERLENSKGAHIFNKKYAGKIAGTKRNGYVFINIGKKTIPAHRLAWLIYHGEWPKGDVVDHVDRNGFNNAIENLREATYAENRKNAADILGVSGIKGVQWIKSRHVWRAVVCFDKKQHYLGEYKTKETASLAVSDFWKQSCTKPETSMKKNSFETITYCPKTGFFYGSRGKPIGHLNRNGYIRVCVGGKTYLAHRLAFYYITGFFPPSDLVVDHVNRDKTDNRFENLRIVSQKNNLKNLTKRHSYVKQRV